MSQCIFVGVQKHAFFKTFFKKDEVNRAIIFELKMNFKTQTCRPQNVLHIIMGCLKVERNTKDFFCTILTARWVHLKSISSKYPIVKKNKDVRSFKALF